MHEDDAVEAELEQPLAAAAAGRRGDRDRLDVARADALCDGAREAAALGADPERIGSVLDVDARDDAAVAEEERGADVELRVRRVGRPGRGDRLPRSSSRSVTSASGRG